jgi:hypothetical protein
MLFGLETLLQIPLLLVYYFAPYFTVKAREQDGKPKLKYVLTGALKRSYDRG